MEYHRTEQGFSFITLFVAIAIISMTLPFIGYLINSVHHQSNYEELAVHHFFQLIRDEVIHAKKTLIQEEKLTLIQEDDSVVSFSLYQDVIRRQLDGRGHEIYLRDVKAFQVTSYTYGVRIKVTNLLGDTYEKTISNYHR
ncbi:ComGF family competence protein [Oceanobacillus piezotolerans]|nr:ComGF family competence protein [Oceanobacillus piezotolerans]